MDSLTELFYQVKDFLNPKLLIEWLLNLLGGYVYFGLFFIVFAETGLAVGFFLPGDSLLVVTGLTARGILRRIVARHDYLGFMKLENAALRQRQKILLPRD